MCCTELKAANRTASRSVKHRVDVVVKDKRKWISFEVGPVVLACKKLELEVELRNSCWKKKSHGYILSSFCFL